jgi:hypothetical protein
MNANFDIYLSAHYHIPGPPAHPMMPSTEQAWGEPLRLLSLGKRQGIISCMQTVLDANMNPKQMEGASGVSPHSSSSSTS